MKYVPIVSITDEQSAETYDIHNADADVWAQQGNFLIGRTIVHNSIPEYVEQRDDPDAKWRLGEHPKIVEALQKTSGVLVFQEQLTRLWQEIAGFTGPEAQEARKAVAKKWKDKLKPVERKWLDGAAPVIGSSAAERWWGKMTTFGRYAFNESHSVAYCLLAHHCLWFKAYYPEEWIASVLGRCGKDKVQRYTESHRSDGIHFGEFNIGRLTIKPAANSGKNSILCADGVKRKSVSLGLINLKGVGDSLADSFGDDPSAEIKEYSSLDDFIAKKGKSKILLERLIKLGAFRVLHPNAKATWRWYLHEYGSGKIDESEKKETKGYLRFQKVSELKAWHRQRLLEVGGWTKQSIEEERKRQVDEFIKQFPKRKMPKKISEWQPKPQETAESIMSLYNDDYDLREMLAFEEQYLSFHWHSMCELYHIQPGRDIESAKKYELEDGEMSCPVVECVITDKWVGMTKNDTQYAKLTISDGKKIAVVLLWESELQQQQSDVLEVGAGVRMNVLYDRDRDSFTLLRGTSIEKLWTKTALAALEDGEIPS